MKHCITINGRNYSEEDLSDLNDCFKKIYGKDSFELSLLYFLEEWYNESLMLRVHTSGSTGKPKELWVEKERMINSARLTVSFLGLKQGDSALLCMPLEYIAGKMVVVRSLVANLNLITMKPCGRPLEHLEHIPDFAAMIPMQVYNSLLNEKDKEKLKKIRHLIIGGGAIDDNMAAELKSFPNNVWSTYGMTETLSHVALRKLNGNDASTWYTPFSNVDIKLSEEGTLVIHAPSVNQDILVTNDIAEINSKRQFRIIGRKDNIINTGGVKVQIEKVETKLKAMLTKLDFMVTSVKDEKFGERIVLLVSSPITSEEDIHNAINILPPYWRPKQIIRCNNLPLTGTGKPDRANARLLAEKLKIKD